MVYQSPCGWPVILEIGRLLSHSLSHSFNQSKMNYFVLQDTLEFSTYLIFTGKIGDRPSGIYPPADTAEFPTEDILLIAMERVTVLFDR